MSRLSRGSSPFSSAPSSLPSPSPELVSPNPLSSPTASQAELAQTEGNALATAIEPSSQPPPAQPSGSGSSTAPTSNMSAKRTPQRTPQASPKRAREEEQGDEHDEATLPKRARSDHSDDEKDEYTPPPKRPTAKGIAKAKAKPKAPAKKTPIRKAAAPKPKPAPRTPARPPTAPSTRPSRSRKAPERLRDYQEAQSTKPTPVRKGMSKVFDPTYITTNSNSRLGKADVYHMLLEPSAWTSLTGPQQTTLISMLPPDAANQALLSRIQAGDTTNTRPRAFSLSNDCFRTDVAKFKEDLSNGHLAKTWLAAAEQAVVERAEGRFDVWKREEGERWWGQKGSKCG